MAAVAGAILAASPSIVWAPQAGSQTLFVSCPVTECLYEGTRGPGKTNALLMDFCQHVGQGHGSAWRGILFRQSYPALDDVVTKSLEWIPKAFPQAKYNQASHVWKFQDGEELLLRYIERKADYWSYHGHEYPWMGWDELTNWANSDCYDVMRSCVRASKPGVPRKIRATANPHGPGHHWVKAKFIDPAPRGTVMKDEHGNERVALHGHYSENKLLMAADPEYEKTLFAATEDDPDRRGAWVEGDWDVSAGTFFGGVWDQKVHVLPDFDIPQDWRIDRAFDWGSSKPFSVGWWAETSGSPAKMKDGTLRHFPRGTLVRIGEWYGMKPGKPNAGLEMGGEEIAKGILERQKLRWPGRLIYSGPADSSIYDVQDGHCIADSFKKGGVTWTPANKGPGSRKNGWDLMRERFKNSKPKKTAAGELIPGEDPGLFVFASCREFIRTVPAMPRSEKNPDDVDTASEDHAGDEARYRVLEPRRVAVASTIRI